MVGTLETKFRLSDQSSGVSGNVQWRGLQTVRSLLRPFNYRGLGLFCRTAARFSGANSPTVVVTLATGGRFCMPIFDMSWQSYIYRNRPYEPEITHLLESLSTTDFDVIDCGANFGYWSAWLSGSARDGERKIIAIEPSPTCLPVLNCTARQNDPHITVVSKAIHKRAGETVDFVVQKNHVASHVINAETEQLRPGDRLVPVETTTLDKTADEFGLGSVPVVVKLDVEGQEINAMQGGTKLARSDALFIYEDHGADPLSKTSAYMLDQGFKVFALLTEPAIVPIVDTKQIGKLKTRKDKGYNFLATKSDFLAGKLTHS